MDVDQYLWRSKTHGTVDEKDLCKPPGIKNLEGWGQVKAPSGKHQGKSFQHIYEEDKMYVNHLWNRSAVSSWVRSFQLYCRHRRTASEEAWNRAKEANPGWEKWGQEQRPTTPRQMPVLPKTSSPSAHSWTMVDPPKTEGYMKTENKRPKEAETEFEEDQMNVEKDPAKIQQLQTQIAILQRELSKELGQGKVHPASSSGAESA